MTQEQIERVAHRHLGVSKPKVREGRRQIAPRLPVVAHACFIPVVVDGVVTNRKPAHCDCKLRVSQETAFDWIDSKPPRAYWIPVFRQNGKQILCRTSIVLTAEFADAREHSTVIPGKTSMLVDFVSLGNLEHTRANLEERIEYTLDRGIERVRHATIHDACKMMNRHVTSRGTSPNVDGTKAKKFRVKK